MISFFRVDPTVGTDKDDEFGLERTPIQLAADKSSVETPLWNSLFADYGFPLRDDEKEELPDDAKLEQPKQECIEPHESLTPEFSPLILLVCFIALAFSFIAWKLI